MMPPLRRRRIWIKFLHHVADDELIQINDLLVEFWEWTSFVEPAVDAAAHLVMISDHKHTKLGLSAIRTDNVRSTDELLHFRSALRSW